MLTRMPVPDTIRQAWGEAVVQDFTTWIGDIMSEQTVRRDEWGEVKTELKEVRTEINEVKTELNGLSVRVTIVEHDLAELKTEMREFRREVNERFDRVIAQFNDRFDRQNSEMTARFDTLHLQIATLHQQIAIQTRWTVGTLAFFCSLVAAMLAISQFRP